MNLRRQAASSPQRRDSGRGEKGRTQARAWARGRGERRAARALVVGGLLVVVDVDHHEVVRHLRDAALAREGRAEALARAAPALVHDDHGELVLGLGRLQALVQVLPLDRVAEPCGQRRGVSGAAQPAALAMGRGGGFWLLLAWERGMARRTSTQLVGSRGREQGGGSGEEEGGAHRC